MEKETEHKNNYLKLTIKDLFRFMPLEITLMISFLIIEAIISIYSVYLISELFVLIEKFYNNSIQIKQVIIYSILYILTIILPMFLNVILDYIKNYSLYKKNNLYVDEVNKKLLKSNLINFEDPNFNNSLIKAKRCISGNNMLNYFMNIFGFIPKAIRIIGTITVLMSFNIVFLPIAAISIIPTLISRVMYYKNLNKFKNVIIPSQRKCNYLWSLLINSGSVKEIRLLDSSDYIRNKWINYRNKCMDEEFKINNKHYNIFLLCDLIEILCYCISIALAINFIIIEKISIGSFSACITAFTSMQVSTKNIIESITKQGLFQNYVKDYYDFLKIKMLKQNNVEKTNDLITLKNVNFQYPQSKQLVLNDINLRINKKELIIIVGENGSGKTTLSKLLSKNYQAKEGKIIYSDSLNISLVLQDFVKYKLTLRENVGLGNINEINNADKLIKTISKIDDNLLDNLQFNDIISKEFGGKEISGGQWQKVAIARQEFKDANLIIIDEPTSAIDPITEYELLNNIIEISKDKAIVLISHRIGICTKADCIIVMKSGKIVGLGKHNELLEHNEYYSYLWNEQAKWYKNDYE